MTEDEIQKHFSHLEPELTPAIGEALHSTWIKLWCNAISRITHDEIAAEWPSEVPWEKFIDFFYEVVTSEEILREDIE